MNHDFLGPMGTQRDPYGYIKNKKKSKSKRFTVREGFHNGENDSHKKQFLALGVHSQSWKLNNLLKKFLVKLTGVTSSLLQFDRNLFLLK